MLLDAFTVTIKYSQQGWYENVHLPTNHSSAFIKALQKDFGGYVMKSNTTGRKLKHCDAIKAKGQ